MLNFVVEYLYQLKEHMQHPLGFSFLLNHLSLYLFVINVDILEILRLQPLDISTFHQELIDQSTISKIEITIIIKIKTRY
jgi:hypothetical protein